MSHGWNSLPIALFDAVCSYISSPVFDSLVVLSAVSRQWRQMVEGDLRGGSDCWRHVPTMNLLPCKDYLMVYPGQRTVKLPPSESALRFLHRVRSLDVAFSGAEPLSSDACNRFLDLLFPPIAPSSTGQSSRVRLDHLTISTTYWSEKDGRRVSSAVSRCLLHCPPVRSAALLLPTMSAAALQHVGSSERLLHLELRVESLSAMVLGHKRKATPPWPIAPTLQSLALFVAAKANAEPDISLLALRELPSLTHLHSPHTSSRVAVDYIAQHLGDRLTFIRLEIDIPLSPSFATQCSALQSLHITFVPTPLGVAPVSEQLHLPSQLSELTIIDARVERVLVVHSLPAHLMYLQLLGETRLVVAHHPAHSGTVELLTTLPPSLLCLSLTMPAAALTDSFLSSLPAKCPQLTHCHVGSLLSIERYGASQEELRAELEQRLSALWDQMSIRMWCETVEAVEQQRLDKRWQREAGVHTGIY